MNKNLLQRRQLLFYFGLGVAGITATKVGFPYLRKANSSSPDSGSPNDIEAGKAIVSQADKGKNLIPFQGISQWFNSAPLSVADLKGSVVLVQFWTFACINCQRTLPYITKWHRQYAAQGLKVIGIHTAEFAFERDPNNIKKALQQHKITYPVAVDNEFKTWNAYENQYWPHLFLFDRQNILHYDHIGEGAYDKTEKIIRQLLN
jgi:thiol-disulfide isomerase/thioredoxin